jgi:hypothetical protein
VAQHWTENQIRNGPRKVALDRNSFQVSEKEVESWTETRLSLSASSAWHLGKTSNSDSEVPSRDIKMRLSKYIVIARI